MATETDLKTELDAIKTNLGGIATRLSSQAAQITALQTQVANGTPVSQAQLDELASEATDLAGTSAALVPGAVPAGGSTNTPAPTI